jgi:hypothetical protein
MGECNHIYGLLDECEGMYQIKKGDTCKPDIVYKFCPLCGVELGEFIPTKYEPVKADHLDLFNLEAEKVSDELKDKINKSRSGCFAACLEKQEFPHGMGYCYSNIVDK